MAYRFPASHRRVAKIKPATGIKPPPMEQEVIGTVQGQTPGSKEEWRVACALYQLGYSFVYQYPVFGGRITGGQVIDFWITSTALPTPLYMNGRAWHNNKNATVDDYKLYKLKKVFHKMIREPVVIWDDEVPSIEAALLVLRRKL